MENQKQALQVTSKYLTLLESQGKLAHKRTSSLTIFEAVKSPTIRNLIRNESEDVIQARITKILVEFSKMVRTDLTVDDLADYAMMMISDYEDMHFDEIIYTLKQALLGKYGKVYPNWRYNDLREWFDKSYQELIKPNRQQSEDSKRESYLEHEYGRSYDKNPEPQGIKNLSEIANQEIQKLKNK